MEDHRYVLGYTQTEGERLAHQHSIVVQTSQEALNVAFPVIDPKRDYNVLEVGSGVGLMIPVLASHFQLAGNPNSKITSIEPSHESIATMKKRIQIVCPQVESQISIISSNIQGIFSQNLIPKGSIDCIFTRYCLIYVPELENVLSILTEWLKPGGKFVFHEISENMYYQPREALIEKGCQAFDQAVEKAGGNGVKVGKIVPKILADQDKVTIDHVKPFVYEGKPGTEIWKWLQELFLSLATNSQTRGGHWTDQDTKDVTDKFKKMSESSEVVAYSFEQTTIIATLK
eukprot:TRINITY_DN16_c0_g1_i1.p3 TRINITY_DN16_c0_g1~~TRINITY_DN16_c0_g1_i1.p3  ORF type:complete len:287 (+),score=55.08 TRINITY_DN16_c0_g1_i1:2155-3015(+)